MGNSILDNSKIKTILIVTDNLEEQINGVVTTFKSIEPYAKDAGYNFVYFSPREFSYVDCPGYSEVKLAWPTNVKKKIEAINPDYVHIATEGPVGFAVRLYCSRNNILYNTSYHTKFPEFLNEMYCIPKFLTYAYLRWFHKKSHCVLTTTDTMVADLKERKFTNRIKAWTRGVDRSIFKSSLRTKVTKEPTLLSVGRVSKEKNLDEFCKLNYKNKIVVGDGPYRRELEKKYPDVQFVGVKRGKELAEYYANADVFVFTSLTDTFGIVIIESLAVGTPVAAYPVPGPIDILENGLTGIMSTDLERAVSYCLNLPRDRVEEYGAKWSWEECWKIFEENIVPTKNTR